MFGNRYKILLVSIVVCLVFMGCSSSDTKGLKLKPSELNFDPVSIGDAVTLDVIVKNTYSTLIEISQIKIDSMDFSITPNNPAPFSLGKGEEAIISVEFKPTSDGAIYGVMVFLHEGSTTPKVLYLSGVGVKAPRIEIPVTNHDFGTRLINMPIDFTFDIKNVGTADLTIDNYTFMGTGASVYTITSGGTVPTVIVAGGTHSITVEFATGVAGTFPAELVIVHDAVNETPSSKITLNGTSVLTGPKLDLNHTGTWDFGTVPTTIPVIMDLELGSIGTGSLTISSLDFATNSEFTLDHIEDAGGNTIILPQTVAVGDKIYAKIKFAPTSKTTFNDTLTIMHSGLYNPAPTTIAVTGVGRDAIEVKFSYTGAVQNWTVPNGVSSVEVECYGAEGGALGTGISISGKGGMAKASVPVTPGDTVYVYVGGQGGTNPGTSGWNGGGDCIGGSNRSGCGGGASDIRIGGTTLNDRVLVGGGGGGSGYNSGTGGAGGDLIGGDGTDGYNNGPGYGGTQTAGGGVSRPNNCTVGTFGVGGTGDGNSLGGGGGGGGWYGGGGGYCSGGGGGSSYYDASGNTNKSMQSGVRSGDGEIIIRY